MTMKPGKAIAFSVLLGLWVQASTPALAQPSGAGRAAPSCER